MNRISDNLQIKHFFAIRFTKHHRCARLRQSGELCRHVVNFGQMRDKGAVIRPMRSEVR